MNLKLIISYFIVLSVLGAETSKQKDLCKEIEVLNANYASCSGIYLATNEFKVAWAKDKPVYRHVKMDRFIFYNIEPYYWCIGKQSHLRTKQFYYYNGISKSEPLSQNNTWKTNAQEGYASVLCHEPKTDNLTNVKENDPSRPIKECEHIAHPWTIWKVISVQYIVTLAVALSCTMMLIVFKAVIILLDKYHPTWRNQ